MMQFVTNDSEQFSVERDIVQRMGIFSSQDGEQSESEGPIPLPNVSSSVFKKVLEYCEYHRNEPSSNHDIPNDDPRRRQVSEIGEWDQNFIQVDQEMLFELILAANYLEIKGLLDVGCKTVANRIKGKTSEEIRKLFNLTSDFTPEEEAQIKKENASVS